MVSIFQFLCLVVLVSIVVGLVIAFRWISSALDEVLVDLSDCDCKACVSAKKRGAK